MMKKSLVSLALVTFSLGVAEFGMMGILGDVAASLYVDIAHAGHFISAYSLGVAIGAPMLIVLRKMGLRSLLLLLATLITIGNICSAVSPGYATLLVSRLISGLPHGAYFGAAAIVCSRLVPPEKGASAVAVMVGGMTVANLVGVPLGTYLSDNFSWRLCFGVAAAVSLAGILGIYAYVPSLKPLTDTGIKGQFRFLLHPEPWLIYCGVFFGQASVYCWFSYIQPSMTSLAGYPMADMTWIMLLAGSGMVAGNIAAGKLADKYGAALVSGTICVLLVGIMSTMYFMADSKVVSVILMFMATAGLFGLGGPLQYLIVRYSNGGEMLGGAGIQISFNVSNAMSAAIGGWAISSGFGVASTAIIGVPFALTGAIALFALRNMILKERH